MDRPSFRYSRPQLPSIKLTGQPVKWKDYYLSQNWADKQREVMAKRGRICERCRMPALKFWVLVLSWQRIGYFLDEDLQVVCEACGMADKLKRQGLVTQAKTDRDRSSREQCHCREGDGSDCPFPLPGPAISDDCPF